MEVPPLGLGAVLVSPSDGPNLVLGYLQPEGMLGALASAEATGSPHRPQTTFVALGITSGACTSLPV